MVLAILLSLVLVDRCTAQENPTAIDSLSFGDPQSETSHVVSADHSAILTGALGEPARMLLPLENQTWEGGSVSFSMKVDPDKINYFTAKFWGSEANPNRLILFCEGKQIGYRHLGDIDILDFGSDGNEPGYNSRFFYSTTPLPIAMTHGKSELHFQIRCTGQIWAYGNTFATFQKQMTQPTRGIYRVYTHTDGYFVPSEDEKQGDPPVSPPARESPGPEVLAQLKQRVNGEIDHMLLSSAPLNQMQMQFLARAYSIKWTHAYHSEKVIAQALKGLDEIFAAYRKDPHLAASDPITPNPDWFGLGPSGDVVRYLIEPFSPSLDQQIDDGKGGKITRRAAYSEMLQATTVRLTFHDIPGSLGFRDTKRLPWP